VLGRLVEHQNGEVGQQGAGDCDSLALPSRQASAHRSHRGGEPLGEPVQPRTQTHPGQHAGQFRVSGGPSTDPEVLGQGGVEQMRTLLDQSDDAPHVVSGKALHRHAVERRLARIGR
jgi:hypothetical protein